MRVISGHSSYKEQLNCSFQGNANLDKRLRLSQHEKCRPEVRMNSDLALWFGWQADAPAIEPDLDVKPGMIRALDKPGVPGVAPGLRRAFEIDPRTALEVDFALRRLPATAAQ